MATSTMERVRRTYWELRKQGHLAGDALRTAKVREAFRRANWAGLVRLRAEPDQHCDLDDLKGETFSRKENPEIPESRMAREELAFEERVARDGVWGLIGEYSLECDCRDCAACDEHEWTHAGSCWGFVGDGWKGSGIDVDIMDETLRALKIELRSRQLAGL